MHDKFFKIGVLYRSLHCSEKLRLKTFDDLYAIFEGVDSGIEYKVGKQLQPYYMYIAISQ